MARVRYSGDIRLELTAELLLEYPITNFVALPVRLLVTGCKFDGLACLAYIRRRAHFCFIDEEQTPDLGDGEGVTRVRTKSLLKEIKVESEIGEKGKGKQVLKNVGKVERFVLEQVRRIFEEEFLFPSSWTFLI
jgi:distribution and morphology protein 12